MRARSQADRNLAILILGVEIRNRSPVVRSPVVPVAPIQAVRSLVVLRPADQVMAVLRSGDIVRQSVRRIASAPMTALICIVIT